MNTAQIGQCGVLLLQYELLLRGIESAPMTTDSGVDLVAYSPANGNAVTIQVKTNLKPKPAGGKGKRLLDWWIPDKSPAQYVALVDLDSERIWVFSHAEIISVAQQHSGGRHHLGMYTDPTAKPSKPGRLSHSYEFEKFLITNRIHLVFGLISN